MSTIAEITAQYNALAPSVGRPIRKAFKDKPSAEAALAALYEESQSRKDIGGGRAEGLQLRDGCTETRTTS